MKAWPAESLNARVWLLLEAAGEKGRPIEDLYGELKAPRQSISMCLWRLGHQGYVQRIEGQLGWWRRVKDGPVPSIAEASAKDAASAPAAAPAEQRSRVGDIAWQAGQLLKKHTPGYDTDELALRIGCTAEEVDRALLPALEDHMLVSCGILRGGRYLQHYRLSAGGVAGYDWRKQAQATWLNRGQQLEQELAARRGVFTPVVPPAPKPPAYQVTTAPAPLPAPQPPKAEVASEVVAPATPAAPPAPTPVPFVGELDIDAVHRQARTRTSLGVSAEEKAALLQTPVAAEEKFECALFNDGRLLVVSNGRQIDLPVDHTRKLLHYLDHLRGDALVEAVLGELHA